MACVSMTRARFLPKKIKVFERPNLCILFNVRAYCLMFGRPNDGIMAFAHGFPLMTSYIIGLGLCMTSTA